MTDRARVDPPLSDTTLDALRADHPEWRIWLSSAGRVWATWPHQLTADEQKVRCARTVDADDIDEMRGELEKEAKKRATLR